MSAVYTIVEVVALLAIIILPLSGPKKKKEKSPGGLSNLSVNDGGYLEYTASQPTSHHPAQ